MLCCTRSNGKRDRIALPNGMSPKKEPRSVAAPNVQCLNCRESRNRSRLEAAASVGGASLRPRPRLLRTASQYGSEEGGGAKGCSTSLRQTMSGSICRRSSHTRSTLSSCCESLHACTLSETSRTAVAGSATQHAAKRKTTRGIDASVQPPSRIPLRAPSWPPFFRSLPLSPGVLKQHWLWDKGWR
eukprot:scaffold171374_cov28-Tisochrysis_lutea.AAC.2